jgi:hypoxanthine phosphoribosyltransferase/predicted HAD superfamily phosphohydrolase YqeG
MIVNLLRKLDYKVLHFMAKKTMRNYAPLSFVDLDHVDALCAQLADKIKESKLRPKVVVGIGTSGIYPAWKLAQSLNTNIGYLWFKKDGFPLDDVFFKKIYLSIFPRCLKSILFEGPLITHKYQGPEIDGNILVVDDETDSGGTLALSSELILEHNSSANIKKAVLYKYPHSKNVDLFAREYQLRETFPSLALRLPMRKYSPFYPEYRIKVDSLGLPDQPPSQSKKILAKWKDFMVEISRLIKWIAWSVGQRIRGFRVEKLFSSIFSIPEDDLLQLKKENFDTLVFDYEGVLKTIRGGIINHNVAPFLTSLSQKGFKWTVISNCSQADGILLKEWFQSKFPEAEVYGDAGKPNPLKVHLALENIHSSPKKAVFIGDNPFLDIKTAKSAGIEKIVLVEPLNKQFAYSWQKFAIHMFYRIFSLKAE